MNDFTKEELLIILLDIGSKNPNPTSKVQIIINKIKFMIDNYSEIPLPTMEDYCCKKCNEEWEKCECNS